MHLHVFIFSRDISKVSSFQLCFLCKFVHFLFLFLLTNRAFCEVISCVTIEKSYRFFSLSYMTKCNYFHTRASSPTNRQPINTFMFSPMCWTGQQVKLTACALHCFVRIRTALISFFSRYIVKKQLFLYNFGFF